jgi:hypothetical protein
LIRLVDCIRDRNNSKIKCFFGNVGSTTTAEYIQEAIFFFFEGEGCDRNCRGYGNVGQFFHQAASDCVLGVFRKPLMRRGARAWFHHDVWTFGAKVLEY